MHAVIVTDAAVLLLSTRYQAVAAWNIWHKDSCISEDWQAGGLAILDDTETFAIAGAFSALASEMDINDVDEIHVFTDSMTAIRQLVDPSIHSAQECALEILFLITPWVEQGDKWIHFHHVPDSEDYMFMPHRLVHNLASSTKIEAGFSAPCFLAFDKKQITGDVFRDWENLLRDPKYTSCHFQHPRWSANRREHHRAKHMAPFHLKGGTWLKDTGHSVSLTAQMACSLTSHAPIGQYRHCFNVGDKVEACTCDGTSPELFQHVFFKCGCHPTRPPDMPSFSIQPPFWEFFGKFIMDNPGAFAFSDDPHSSTTLDSIRCVGHWTKDVSLPSECTKVKVRAGAPLLSAQGGASPRGAVRRGHMKYGVVLHCSFAHSDAHVNTFVYNRQPRPQVRSISLERCQRRLFFTRA